MTESKCKVKMKVEIVTTSFIVKIVPTDIITTMIVLNTSVTTAYSMLLDIEYLTAHVVEADDFNSSGG
jgi:hypothetical protein